MSPKTCDFFFNFSGELRYLDILLFLFSKTCFSFCLWNSADRFEIIHEVQPIGMSYNFYCN